MMTVFSMMDALEDSQQHLTKYFCMPRLKNNKSCIAENLPSWIILHVLTNAE